MTTNMSINMATFAVLFLIVALLMRSRFQPAESFGQRCVNGLLVSLIAVVFYLPLVVLKELVLYSVIYGERINIGRMDFAEWVFLTIITTILPLILLAMICPFVLAALGWNRPVKN